MHAAVSERREYESCRYRFVPHSGDQVGSAVCRLIEEITEFSENECRVDTDVCSACCRAPWPSGSRMNSVVASVIYATADRLQTDGAETADADRLGRLKRLSLNYLDLLPSEQTKRIVPARATRTCCYLGELLTDDGGSRVFKCHHPAHETTTDDQCRRCRDWAVSPLSQRLPLPALIPLPASRGGPTVRNWAVGITTAPRREPTLGICADSVIRAGWERPQLFVDAGGQVPKHLRSLSGTWRDQRIGAWPNFFLALAELVQTHPQADAFLMLQDDAYLYDADNVREYLEQVLWPGPEPGLVSLVSTAANVALTDGWSFDAAPWWCGALAFVFPAELARRFVLDQRIVNYRSSDPAGGMASIDSLIGQWAATEGIAVWYPVPSLVQHVGHESSTLWNGSGNWAARHSPYFAGDVEMPFHEDATLADFPESEFSPADEFRDDFDRRVADGRQKMGQSRVVVCGLCRDVRSALPRTIARIERLGQKFHDYRVVLFENDSQDGTLEFLHDWACRNTRVILLQDTLGIPRFAQTRNLDRMRHMATCRERYRTHVLSHFPNYDFVIVVDTDLRGGWSYDGVANTFGHDDWDFVGSNGILRRLTPTFPVTYDVRQYDTWALRYAGRDKAYQPWQMDGAVHNPGEPLVPVWSCFGGLGVYSMAAFRAANYGGNDCEHVELHRQMRAAGHSRLFLNPSQIVLY